MSDGDENRIERLLDTGVLPFLIKHLKINVPNIQVPILRTLGNIASCSEEQTQMLLNNNILQEIEQFLTCEKKVIKRETCWLLSNITAGNGIQVACVVNNFSIIEKLFQCCNDSYEVKKEAFFSIRNAISKSESKELQQLLNFRVIELLLEMLKNPDIIFILESIKSLDVIMEKSQ